jgi:hypothetical protein
MINENDADAGKVPITSPNFGIKKGDKLLKEPTANAANPPDMNRNLKLQMSKIS